MKYVYLVEYFKRLQGYWEATTEIITIDKEIKTTEYLVVILQDSLGKVVINRLRLIEIGEE